MRNYNFEDNGKNCVCFGYTVEHGNHFSNVPPNSLFTTPCLHQSNPLCTYWKSRKDEQGHGMKDRHIEMSTCLIFKDTSEKRSHNIHT